ncbi:ATP-binding cassette transporter [Cryptococcus deuterogattii 99/473]|uniref:ATP-binding cassette transporter n=1 Tax=Cryptococcus deuterogattii Ram5 TaxID=1296110 RepID=A0A0D0V7N4_9TREE|nr:ATP-binding cassette transporter [Cryptococcus deuterogattii Ram5]KIY56119.1 ATP-binding cassette transporter [Cryptococcus deuterogattii 99/473]
MDVSKIDPPSPFLISTIRTVPSLIVLLLPLLFSIPPFKQLGDRLAPVFSDFVTLRSLVPPEPATSAQKADEQARRPKAWKGFVLAAFSLAEAATWTGITGWKILQLAQGDGTTLRDTLLSIGMVVVWLGIFSIFAFRPLTTPPWSILIISILLFVVSAWAIGQAWYIRTITGFLPSWASSGRITLEFLNIGATATIILVLGSLKLASPEVLSRLPQVAPDDDVTLLSWMTFGWVDSFIRYGNSQELEPEDLPLLSMTQQTRIVFEKFRQAATSKLVYKLFLANKLDMALDGSLTLVSVILNYAGPFFLNRILRRAAVRIKAELTAAVYDKALRRKDASGIVSKTGAEDKESDGKQEKMSNADSGKVVNLMSGDTTRIANTVSGAYFIYSAPFEILVASIFLYNILGWSAFAGIVVLAVAAPLNSFVSSRSVKITQDLLKARDKRIGVMNELIGAIQFIKSLVSVQRIEDFLAEDEVPDWVSSLKRSETQNDEPTKIGFENASFRWNTGKQSSLSGTIESSKGKQPASAPAPLDGSVVTDGSTVVEETFFMLSDLNINFPIGRLSVITGPTGSGKTALLTALLGEMELLSGRSYLPKNTTQVDSSSGLRNSIAYAAQTPWLQQTSIKNNILFGEPFDEERYEMVLEACALGGQKARVALARAVYSYTQHLLLDDPLAAVDSHTAKHLTDKCLDGPILKGRTVLLLPSTDYLVRILDGRVDIQGTIQDLRERGDLDGMVALEEAELLKEEDRGKGKSQEEEVVEGEDADVQEIKKEKNKGPGKKLIQDEERAIGNVKWETYKLYIVAATYTTWAWTLLVLILSQLCTVAERYWLKVWGEAYSKQHATTLFTMFKPAIHDLTSHYFDNELHQHVLQHSVSENVTFAASEAVSVDISGITSQFPSAETDPTFYLAVYTAIGVASSGIGAWSSYRAAVIMRATVRFFSVTPLGRIINRFSRGELDPQMHVLPAALISYLYYQYSVLYLRVGRSLRRLEATLRSPIFSGFAELLDGVISVRAFSAEARFMEQLCKQVDQTNQAFYYYWLLLRFDFLGAISVALTTWLALSGAVPAGSAGMAIVSAQSFVSACYWVSRFWGQLEMDFNSVERVQEYLSVPQEPPAVIPSNRPPAYWPANTGAPDFLSVRDIEIKYAPDLPTVFKGSFDIKAGEKIGLIGRTGSGKSTLGMSLLRFTDPTSGSIVLDGIDITKIGVDDLVRPFVEITLWFLADACTDAVLFSGTVRENLDPFAEHTDVELYDALARVNLGPHGTSPLPSRIPSRVASSRRLDAIIAEESAARSSASSALGSALSSANARAIITLTTEVSAGGSNFSQGQRQLVAMARALLRRSNLIIMDEATASVDFATDEAIQAAIRSEFKDSTLLTIAHRLSSVIDYDRLLVLSDGAVAEFDTPINLLRKDGSLFKTLCEKSGKYKELFKAAEKKEQEDQEKESSSG